MKKILLSMLMVASVSPIVVSCSTNTKEFTDKNLNKNINVTKVIKTFGLNDVNATINDPSYTKEQFINDYKAINTQSNDYYDKISKVINKNWMFLISNIDSFTIEQNLKNKWFLYEETDKIKYNPLYKHSLGIITIKNENQIPHAHIKFPDRVLPFKTISGVSRVFKSRITNQKTIYITYGKLLIKLSLINGKINIDPYFLYFIPLAINPNKKFHNTSIKEKDEFDIIERYLNNKKIDEYILSEFTDKGINEVGTPTNVYLKL